MQSVREPWSCGWVSNDRGRAPPCGHACKRRCALFSGFPETLMKSTHWSSKWISGGYPRICQTPMFQVSMDVFVHVAPFFLQFDKKWSLCKTLLYLMDSFLFLIMDTTCPATRDLCCYVFLCPLRLILFYWCLSLFVVLFSISHEAVVSRAGGASHPNGLLQAVCQ